MINMYFFGLQKNKYDSISKSISKLLKKTNERLYYKTIQSLDLMEASEGIEIYFCVPEGEVNDVNGISYAKQLRKKNKKCFIIFLSENYLSLIGILRDFICPVGYFLLPDDFNDISKLLSTIINDSEIDKDTHVKIKIISEYKKHYISAARVLFFASSNKKIICQMDNGERIEFYESLSTLEKQYNSSFIRCHASFLVNKDKIIMANCSSKYLKIENSEELIPVSRKYKTILEKIIYVNLPLQE